MAWRDNLRPASFRGVPFRIDSASLIAGRRLARHEYPQRDMPYLEDMGRKAREYRIEAMILGSDYMRGRDELIAALEAPGAGQLVHPYYGTLQVVVSGDCEVSESTQHGGLASITIVFVEAGKRQEPKSGTDSKAVLDVRYGASNTAFEKDFAGKFTVSRLPDYVAKDAMQTITAALSLPALALGNLAWIRANPASALTWLLAENLPASLRNPSQFARGVTTLIRSIKGSVSLLGYSLTKTSGVVTPARLVINSNRDALSTLIVQAATARRIMDLTGTTPATLDDAQVSRAEIVRLSDAVLLSPVTGQAAADAMLQLRSDAVTYFAEISPGLPRLTAINPQAVRPAIVVAHDFYGDSWLSAGREDELIQRNRLRHPGYVPAGQTIWMVS